jgi:beta-phosphoglucomutase-like phosphatase (HAD superfamily)
MHLSAVVFDFDGVIADSEPLHFEGFRRVLAGEGVTLSKRDYYERYLGYDDAGAFRAALADHGQRFDEGRIAGLVADKVALFPQLLAGHSVIYPGAASCIVRLGAEVPLAIASGAALDDIEAVLRGTGLRDRFRTIVAAEHTPRSKPHPDPYRRAVDNLREQGVVDPDVSARHVVAIEDSVWGLQSARDAGLRTVAVTTSYRAAELGIADLVVASLDGLTVERLDALVAQP